MLWRRPGRQGRRPCPLCAPTGPAQKPCPRILFWNAYIVFLFSLGPSEIFGGFIAVRSRHSLLPQLVENLGPVAKFAKNFVNWHSWHYHSAKYSQNITCCSVSLEKRCDTSTMSTTHLLLSRQLNMCLFSACRAIPSDPAGGRDGGGSRQAGRGVRLAGGRTVAGAGRRGLAAGQAIIHQGLG